MQLETLPPIGGKPMSDNTQVVYRGPGLCTLLAVLFIGLKLCNQIDWSWWWVLSPLWIPIALILGILAIVLVFAGLAWCVAACFESKPKPRQPNKFRGL